MESATSTSKMYTEIGLMKERIDQTSLVISNIGVNTAGWTWRIVWSWTNLLQLLLTVVGIVGNLLVIFALLGRKAARYSTDIFIGALAVADFLTSVFMIPIPVAGRVPDTLAGNVYCKLVFSSYLMWLFVTASAFILTGMSVERFVAVVCPLHFHQIFTKRRVYFYLASVSVCAVFANYCFTATVRVIGNRCVDTKTHTLRIYLTIYLFVLRMGVPVLTMLVTQIGTAISLHRQSRELQAVLSAGTGKDNTPSFHVKARNRMVQMTATVVIVFMLSLGPNHVIIMISAVKGTLDDYLFSPFYYAIVFLTLLNSCVNPFIYAARYPRFRKAIRGIFTAGLSGKRAPVFDHGVGHSHSDSTQVDTSNLASVSSVTIKAV
ncbi:melatonin receptor type 1A-like [Diadema antillarum]|uniref:melatonin receptor type 1A-like n=1 Tax=Diadema antillarum TaxID=105358 RepID=UPI003A858DF5